MHRFRFFPFGTAIAQLQNQVFPAHAFKGDRFIKFHNHSRALILAGNKGLDRSATGFPATRPRRIHIITATDPDPVTGLQFH